MFKLNWQHLQFSLVSFTAAMLALYWSMSIDLQQPYWSMLTVYILSQPMAAAVRSKAIQRLLGTLLGIIITVIMVPRLVNTPLLLCLGLALWVGGCLAISLLDRSPRSYIMMLAGYTAAIVGFSSVNTPGQVFELAVARAEEISIGIICATMAHSLWFPRPVGEVLRERIEHWLNNADHWALDILQGQDSNLVLKDRVRLASAASEIHMLTTHLPFDTSELRETTAIVRSLHDRILMLIPTLASLGDRLAALRQQRATLDHETQTLLAAVAQWINEGAPAASSNALLQEIATQNAQAKRDDWYDLNRIGLLTRLQDLIQTLAEGRSLLKHLQDPNLPLSAAQQSMVAQAEERPLHSDGWLALLSGLAATSATMICCVAWIGLGWAEGSAAAMLSAILCCLFATMDDPTPAIKMFGFSICAAVFLAGIYLFAIFPMIDSFPLLALTLAPALLPIGMMTLHPKQAGPALITLLNFCNFMALQERLNPDFASFLNLNLSQFFGVFVAIYVTRSMRSMNAEASARRMLKQTWQSLARLAQGRHKEQLTAYTSRLVDRIGLLTPRLAATNDTRLSDIDLLKELRISIDLSVIHDLSAQLPPLAAKQVDELLQAVGEHYMARSQDTPAHEDHLLQLIDTTLSMLSQELPPDHSKPLAALIGLRRNLFPGVYLAPSGVIAP